MDVVLQILFNFVLLLSIFTISLLSLQGLFLFPSACFFFTTVYTQYYFILVSGVQQSGWMIIYFTKCPPDISSTHWHRT